MLLVPNGISNNRITTHVNGEKCSCKSMDYQRLKNRSNHKFLCYPIITVLIPETMGLAPLSITLSPTLTAGNPLINTVLLP